MKACTFDFYLTQIAQLTRAQCVRVLALLKPAVDQGHTAAIIEDAVAPRLCCPRWQNVQQPDRHPACALAPQREMA
jgi:hypothetical protein